MVERGTRGYPLYFGAGMKLTSPGVSSACGRSGGARPTDDRYAGVELLRVLSCVGVAVFHLLPAGQPAFAGARTIGYSGLFALTAVMAGLAIPRRAQPASAVLKKRAARLLIPWLFWVAIFGGLMLVRRGLRGSPLLADLRWFDVLIGPRVHLWFLPFAFVTTVLIALAFRPAQRPGPWAILLAAASIPAAIAAVQLGELGLPWKLYVTAAPAVLLGLALGRAAEGKDDTVWRCATCLAYAASAAGTALLSSEGQAAWAHSAAALAVVVCFSWRSAAPPWLAWAASLSLGVYLVHPLCSDLLWGITASNPPLHVLAVILVSGALIACVQATPLRQFV